MPLPGHTKHIAQTVRQPENRRLSSHGMDRGIKRSFWQILKVHSFSFQMSQKLSLLFSIIIIVPSQLWRCWLGGRKGIQTVKTEWWGAGGVICLERGADLHIAQLMPLLLTVSCFSKIHIGFTFLVLAHLGSPGKGLLNGCVFNSKKAMITYTWTLSPVIFFKNVSKCCLTFNTLPCPTHPEVLK